MKVLADAAQSHIVESIQVQVQTLPQMDAQFAVAVIAAQTAAQVYSEDQDGTPETTREAQDGVDDVDDEESAEEVYAARTRTVDVIWVDTVMGHLTVLATYPVFAVVLRCLLTRSRIRAAGVECMRVSTTPGRRSGHWKPPSPAHRGVCRAIE